MGIWWSFYRFESQNSRPDYSQGTIHVLANKDVLPDILVSEFEKQYRVKVLLTEYASDLKIINEIYSNSDRYDIVQMNSLQVGSLVFKDTFLPIQEELVPEHADISPDFLNLPFDRNKAHSIPFTWGLNGYLVDTKHISIMPQTFKELLYDQKFKGKVSLMAHPVEFLQQLKRYGDFSDEWIQTESKEPLTEALNEFGKYLYSKRGFPEIDLLNKGDVWVQQIPLGKSANYLQRSPHFKYWIPKDKVTLWVNIVAIPKQTKKAPLAHLFINHLLKPISAHSFAYRSHLSTVIKSAETMDLAEQHKPSFLRSVNIHSLDMVTEHQAYQSIWLRSLGSVFPDLFNNPTQAQNTLPSEKPLNP